VEVAIGSELGLWQRRQSDAHVAECIAPNVTLFALADGFGELGRGVSAAPMAIGTLRDYLRRRYRAGSFGRSASPNGLKAILLAALDHANARLYAQSGSHEDFVGSGTSLTAVLLVGHQALVGHVGDARAYLLRLGRLDMLTSDDAMFADAAVTSSKTFLPPKPRTRGLLWRSLGTQAKLEASIAHVELLAGDQLILCTDGVHRCIDDDELSEALVDSETAADAVARVLSTAKARGNVDNGTLIVGRELLVASAPAFGAGAQRSGPLRAIVAIALVITSLLSFGAYWLHIGVPDPPANYSSNGR
jgi:protein phosphatase